MKEDAVNDVQVGPLPELNRLETKAEEQTALPNAKTEVKTECGSSEMSGPATLKEEPTCEDERVPSSWDEVEPASMEEMDTTVTLDALTLFTLGERQGLSETIYDFLLEEGLLTFTEPNMASSDIVRYDDWSDESDDAALDFVDGWPEIRI
uniref:Uncharacterized protein n=1 Tax=Tetraselmis chuii TaxID=63592 RepID=A0A6U1JII3_9CHLO|mmetsp:Transcript_38075/g.68304  ORF Transcript_38075/g.68304 Transcript_38075/m.68304 type:complete len:151 (+) Transcript_38075:253-705(+)